MMLLATNGNMRIEPLSFGALHRLLAHVAVVHADRDLLLFGGLGLSHTRKVTGKPLSVTTANHDLLAVAPLVPGVTALHEVAPIGDAFDTSTRT
jgi:hypothetical protein